MTTWYFDNDELSVMTDRELQLVRTVRDWADANIQWDPSLQNNTEAPGVLHMHTARARFRSDHGAVLPPAVGWWSDVRWPSPSLCLAVSACFVPPRLIVYSKSNRATA